MKFWDFFNVAQYNTQYGFQILFTHIRGSVGCIAVSVCVFLWRGRREDEGKDGGLQVG